MGHSSSKDSSRSRGSPRASRKEPSSQVVTLDERNLKRAVNRYGTMPKGARIGAYLESLRQSGMTPEPVTEQGVESDAVVDSHASESMDRSMVGKPSKQTQMLRSNSSHGGFTSNNSGVVSKSPSNNQVRRVQQGSLERSLGLSTPPAPEFDFPPPPADLPPPSPSPRAARKATPTDKENLPERLERNKKDSDSCEEVGLPIKSPMSPVSENRTLGSPAVGSLSSPGSTLDHDYKRNTFKSETSSSDAIKPSMIPEHDNTPADMLVSELFESFKAKSKTTPKPPEESKNNEIDFKANLRKTKKQPSTEEESANKAQFDFKSNLRKKSDPGKTEVKAEESNIVDFKAKLRKSSAPKSEAKDEPADQPIDFKARLRKVSGSKSPTKTNEDPSKQDSDPEPDDKRKSTGSISSLRKMWESSPRPLRPPTDLDKLTPDDPTDKLQTVKFEKRVWPPVPNTETEKPMVPVKPTVKPPAPTTKPPPPSKPPPKPAMAVKPNVCNIYAAPTVQPSKNKPPLASRPNLKQHEPASGGSGCSSSEMSDKEELLGISQKLDTSINAAKVDCNKSSLLKLSEDIGSFAESASGYVDNVPATGRFRFRSLLNKLEQQSGELRSVGKSRADIPAKLCGEIQITVRDLVSVIQR